MKGIIYILSSSIFRENIYKVGRSRNFTNRLRSYKTSFGTDPIIHMEKEVNNDELIEKLIHIKLRKFRFKDKSDKYAREHYNIGLDDLINKINEIIDYVIDDECSDDNISDIEEDNNEY